MTVKVIHAEVYAETFATRNKVIAKVTLEDGRNGIASILTGKRGAEPVTASDKARAKVAAIANATQKPTPSKTHSSDAHAS